ncbi:MAG: NADH-quinone oxidoreductase subunit N [Armatimonadota bacterium]|nr:NADH-quinone oxidoreductase subunit N [Armatimonadota bacterium]
MEATINPEQILQSYDIAVLAPELVLSFFALAVLLVGAFFPDMKELRVFPGLAMAGTAVSIIATAALWNKNATFGPPETASYVADNFSLFFKWIFLIGLAVTILISKRFLTARTGDRHTVIGEFFALLMLCTVGMMMVAAATDLLVVFLGIETFSIALYILAGFARRRLMSNEASLKYFLLGAFATGFFLYGIALTYYATGSTLLAQIADSIHSGKTYGMDRPIPMTFLQLGFAFILIGLGFKAALVPFHQWTPDVYEGSPTPVTAFMAVGAKTAAFAAILRVFAGAFSDPQISAQWHHLVLVIAVLTMTVGNVVAIAQDSLKRMLAYSSIAHAGYVLLGVLASATAIRSGADADTIQKANAGILFYLAVYALMNLGAFAVLVYLEQARDAIDPDYDSEDADMMVHEIGVLAWRSPLLAAALTVFMLSLAGIPPTAGFFGKLYVFQSAVGQQLIGLVIVGVLNTVISVYYYLRPIVVMYMQEETEVAPAIAAVAASRGAATASAPTDPTFVPDFGFTFAVSVAIALCVLLMLAMSIAQAPVLDWAQEAATVLPKR